MYDKEQIRQRFLEEVERLITDGVARSYSKIAEGCGLQPYHLSDIRNSRSEVSLQVVTHFVTSYREHGVSYGYILEGKPEKAVVPRTVLDSLERAMEKISTSIKYLSN